MDRRKKNVRNIFEDLSDSSPMEDPYHDDGEYGSDHDYCPPGDPQGSCSDTDDETVNRRKQGKKSSALKVSAARVLIKPRRLQFNGDSSSNEGSSSDENLYDREEINNSSDIQNSCGSNEIDFNVNRKLLVAALPSQSCPDHNDGTGYNSSSSEEIFPLAKRLKKPTDHSVTRNDSSTLPRLDTSVPKNYEIAVATDSTHEITVNTPTHLPAKITPDANEKAHNTHGFHAMHQNASQPLVNEENHRDTDASSPTILASEPGCRDEQNMDLIPCQLEFNSDQNEVVCPNRMYQDPTNNIVADNSVESTEEEWLTTVAPIPEFGFDADSTGFQFPIDENTSVIDIFNRLFPAEIIDFIVECTNNYGNELCLTNRPKTRNSRSISFKPTDRDEIKKFLGLCLLAGQINVPQKRKLFTLSDVLYYHPIFVASMSGRRFEQILRCLSVAPMQAKGHEKISQFMDAVSRNFRLCYKPEKELSLDESLLLFRGRLSFRQYIKSKKAKYGIKFYELTTASGYVLNLHMYTGKEDDAEKGKKLEKTVMRLMRPYVLKGHELFMDNYYNSVGLSEKMIDLRTHTTGTLRVNRKNNPKDIVNKKLKKGEHVWGRRNKVYVSKWVDKRAVVMITTKVHPEMVNSWNRHGQLKRKPKEVVMYNDFMSGIDRADQMVSYYSSPRKSLRWYKKVFFHLLDLAVWNSFYVYKKNCMNNDKKYEFLCYRDELIRNLVKIRPEQKPSTLIQHSTYDNRRIERVLPLGSSSVVATTDTAHSGHWPEKIPVPIGSKKTSNYLKCKMCAKKKLRKETGIRCKGCEDKPSLCALCFEEWHDQL